MVARQNGQEAGARCVPLMLISAATFGLAQRATVDPGLVDPGSGNNLCEEGQLRVRRCAGFIVPAVMDAPTRRLDGKRLQPHILNANLCPGRLTRRVTLHHDINSYQSIVREISTVQLPNAGLLLCSAAALIWSFMPA